MVNQGERERPAGEGGIDPKRYPMITAMRRAKDNRDAEEKEGGVEADAKTGQ